jgi:transposase
VARLWQWLLELQGLVRATSPWPSTAQINRLRALLRDAHDDTDRQLARAALTDATLSRLARRRLPGDASREQAIRHAEICRLALAIHDARQALKDSRA